MEHRQIGVILCAFIGLVACNPIQNETGLYAPSVDHSARSVDPLIVGHRLMDANQPELALQNYHRAAASHGLTSEILLAIGTANLELGRLNQAFDAMSRATEQDPTWPEAWNNLGVVLMEQNKTAEAVQVFRKAFALANGKNDAIRDNLRLALENLENPVYDDVQNDNYNVIRRGDADYLISSFP